MKFVTGLRSFNLDLKPYKTKEPYIQEMMVCAPRQSITCLLPIVLHMTVLLYLK